MKGSIGDPTVEARIRDKHRILHGNIFFDDVIFSPLARTGKNKYG
jgi:hypothetical protein